MRELLKCYVCKWSASDPDDIYCGHPVSLKNSNGYGQGLSRARSVKGVCGSEAKLFERCRCRREFCPRHQDTSGVKLV